MRNQSYRRVHRHPAIAACSNVASWRSPQIIFFRGRKRRQCRLSGGKKPRPRGAPGVAREGGEIGRASCREREWQYVSISGVAVSVTKTGNDNGTELRDLG